MPDTLSSIPKENSLLHHYGVVLNRFWKFSFKDQFGLLEMVEVLTSGMIIGWAPLFFQDLNTLNLTQRYHR